MVNKCSLNWGFGLKWRLGCLLVWTEKWYTIEMYISTLKKIRKERCSHVGFVVSRFHSSSLLITCNKVKYEQTSFINLFTYCTIVCKFYMFIVMSHAINSIPGPSPYIPGLGRIASLNIQKNVIMVSEEWWCDDMFLAQRSLHHTQTFPV